MDVDSEHGRNLPYLSYFEISNNFAWRDSRPQEIEHRRVLLSDLLIYDLLLRSGGIGSPDILYPPRDEPSLVRLLEAIENSNYDALKKDCLVYFLLKWHQDGREDKFAAQKSIPPQFSALADAYWHLDSGINLTHGISILADARLNRDYTSKILQAISLSADASILIRKYVRTAKPPLTEPDDIELFTLALADSSLLDAWQYQRTFHETSEIRPRLLRKVLEWCVLPKPRPSALMQLLSLPLSAFEEATLHSYVLRPPITLSPDAVPLLQDLVCVRLIQLGRYLDAIRMDRKFADSKMGSNSRQSQERAKMVKDLYDALPMIERTFIDAELAAISTRGKPQTALQMSPNGGDISMSQSWEEIQPLDLYASTSKPPAAHRDGRPLPERSNAPRFGGSAPSPPTAPAAPLAPQLPTLLTSSVNHQTRQSFPLPTLPTVFSTPSGARPRPSLSNTANRLSLGTAPHISSPLSGIKFPVHASQTPKQTSHTFVSANRQQNAFYTPSAKLNGHAQPPPVPLEPLFAEQPVGENDETDKDDADMEAEAEEHEQNMDDEDPETGPTEEASELAFSVFSNGISGWTNIENNVTETTPIEAKPEGRSISTSVKRKVPGGFTLDEEDEDMDQDEEATTGQQIQAEEVQTARTNRSKQSTSARTSTRSRKKPRSRRQESKERRSSPRPSIPGSLTDGDGEDEDHVAPLRGKKSNGKSLGTTGRTSRASTASDNADELWEGIQTRRRSSRLTTAASSGNVAGSPETSPTSQKKTSSRPRKSTTKSATRKKRGT